jgi:hypothetical protein
MGLNTQNKISMSSPWLRRTAVAVISVVIVAVIGVLDSGRQLANSQALGLRWARQMAVQAESLALIASEKGEKDPLAWAARLLTQGTDSRIVFVSKYHADGFQQVSTTGSEEFKFDREAGVLDYAKVLYPEDAAGIRVKVFVTRNRIFGAKSVFAQDLTFATLFAFYCYFLNLLWLRRWSPEPEETPAIADAPAEDGAFKIVVTEWIEQAKQTLVELALHIREMTRSAQKLSSTALDARRYAAQAKETIEQTIHERRSVKQEPNELSALATETEAAFLKADVQTKNLIRKLLQTTISKATQVNVMERKLEQALQDCDQAFLSLKDVSGHAQEMSAEITKTTTEMQNQSRMMTRLKKQA